MSLLLIIITIINNSKIQDSIVFKVRIPKEINTLFRNQIGRILDNVIWTNLWATPVPHMPTEE